MWLMSPQFTLAWPLHLPFYTQWEAINSCGYGQRPRQETLLGLKPHSVSFRSKSVAELKWTAFYEREGLNLPKTVLQRTIVSSGMCSGLRWMENATKLIPIIGSYPLLNIKLNLFTSWWIILANHCHCYFFVLLKWRWVQLLINRLQTIADWTETSQAGSIEHVLFTISAALKKKITQVLND